MPASVGDDASYPGGGSSLRHCDRLLQSRPDVMDVVLYYNTLESWATLGISDLALGLQTPPQHLEWST